MSWRNTIKKEATPTPTPAKASWRDSIKRDVEVAPAGEASTLDRLKALPEGVANAASMVSDYVGRSARGEIPLSEQVERAGTALRGAGDVVQSIGDLPSKAIASLLGLDYEGAGAKSTAKLLDSTGLADKDALEAHDKKYPGARIAGQIAPQLALGGTGIVGNAVAGAVGSAGTQLSDRGEIDAGDLAFETALSAGIPAALQGGKAGVKAAAATKAGQWVGEKATQAGKWTGTQAVRVATGLPEDTIQRYAGRNAQVRAAKPLEDIATDTTQAVRGLAKRLSQGSGESGEILARENVQISTDRLLQVIEDRIAERKGLGTFTPEAEREVGRLEELRNRLMRERRAETVVTSPRGDRYVPGESSEVVITRPSLEARAPQRAPVFTGPNARGSGDLPPIETEPVSRGPRIETVRRTEAGEFVPQPVKVDTVRGGLRTDPIEALSGKQAKEFLKQIDAVAFPQQGAGDITPRISRDFQDIRRVVSDQAKEASPAFRAKMAEVAEDAKLLERLDGPFKNEEAAYGTLNRIARERAPFRDRTLRDLDAVGGTDFAEAARDSMARDAFQQRSVNGSRNVNLFSNIPVVGAVLGYAADYVARPATAKVIDWGLAAKEFAGRLPPKYARVLEASAVKGPQSLLLTHNLLMQSDEEYRRLNGQ